MKLTRSTSDILGRNNSSISINCQKLMPTATNNQSLEKLHRKGSDISIKITESINQNEEKFFQNRLTFSILDVLPDNQFDKKFSNNDDPLSPKQHSAQFSKLKSRSVEFQKLSRATICQKAISRNLTSFLEGKARSINSSHTSRLKFNDGLVPKQYEEKSVNLFNTKERIDKLFSQSDFLLNSNVWTIPIAKYLKTSFIQSKFVLEKAYARLVISPETEKDFIENLLTSYQNFVSLFKSIKILMKTLLDQQKMTERQAQTQTDEIKKLSEVIGVQKTERSSFRDEKQLIKFLENSLKKEKLHMEKMENIWSIERQQLQGQISLYEKELELTKKTGNIKELEKKYDILNQHAISEIKILVVEKEKKDTELAKFEILLNRSVSQIKDTKSELDSLKIQYAKNNQELVQLKEKLLLSENLQNRYREIAQMSQQDIFQLTNKVSMLKTTISDFQVKYLKIENQLNKTLEMVIHNGGYSLEETRKDTISLNCAKEIFSSIKYPIFTSNLYSKHTKGLSFPQDSVQLLEKYSFYKPTFLTFLDQEILAKDFNIIPDPIDVRTKDNKAFIGIIRGIMDSKFLELIQDCNSLRSYTPFPDFVYGWLNCFMICPLKRNIRIIYADDNITLEKRIKDFCKFLSNPYTTKLWDVEVFKLFLDEKCGSDEVFFYLYCRNMLFKGPQIQSLAGTENVIHWILFEKIEIILRTVLGKIGNNEFNELKNKLKGRAKTKKKKIYADSALLLKVLLESYRNEKKKKFDKIRQQFLNISVFETTAKPSVPFDSFKQYLQINFPFLTDTEKARLYRESWCLGNGIVDGDSFLIVANEHNLLFEGLKKVLFSDPKFNQVITPKTERNTQFSSEFVPHFAALSTSIEIFKKCAADIGIEEMVSILSRNQGELITQISNNPQPDLKSFQYISSIILETLTFMIKIRNLYSYKHQFRGEKDTNFLSIDMNALANIVKLLSHCEEQDRMFWEVKEKSAQKIQQFFRQKKSGWFEIIKMVLAKGNQVKANPTFDSKMEKEILENGILDLL